MQFQNLSFGSIRIDGTTLEHDVVIEGGEIRKHKKKRPINSGTNWTHSAVCKGRHTSGVHRLVIGTYRRLPVSGRRHPIGDS